MNKGAKVMFNIYYINYAKAYEIAMLFDNHLLKEISKEKDTIYEGQGKGNINTDKLDNVPILKNVLPKVTLEGDISGSKTKKVIDTVQVISTKSTILNVIYEKSKEAKSGKDNSIGQLIKIRNVRLHVENAEDVQGSKALTSGILRQIPIDGMGNVDLTGFADVFLKDSAYILSGKLESEIDGADSILLKIPMQAENEMESQYSISDLEVGPTTVLGVYRGKYLKRDLIDKIDLFHSNKRQDTVSEIESDLDENNDGGRDMSIDIHFIDVIAIIQELIIK